MLSKGHTPGPPPHGGAECVRWRDGCASYKHTLEQGRDVHVSWDKDASWTLWGGLIPPSMAFSSFPHLRTAPTLTPLTVNLGSPRTGLHRQRPGSWALSLGCRKEQMVSRCKGLGGPLPLEIVALVFAIVLVIPASALTPSKKGDLPGSWLDIPYYVTGHPTLKQQPYSWCCG